MKCRNGCCAKNADGQEEEVSHLQESWCLVTCYFFSFKRRFKAKAKGVTEGAFPSDRRKRRWRASVCYSSPSQDGGLAEGAV